MPPKKKNKSEPSKISRRPVWDGARAAYNMQEIVQVTNIPDLLHSVKSNTPHPEYRLPRTSYQSQKLQNSMESNTLASLFYSFLATRDKIEQDKIIPKLIKLIMWTRKPEKQKPPNGTKSLPKKYHNSK